MQRMFVFLLLCLPAISFAQISDEEYLKLNLDSIKRDESKTNLDYLEISGNWKWRELEKVEADMKQMNPELVESLKGESDTVKAGEYKSWLAKKTFEDFYDRYMQDMKQYSQKLGRKIEERDVLKGTGRNDWIIIDYELSRDDLTDCHTDPVVGDRLCYEPDGYIEYRIRYTENKEKGSKNLSVTKDVPEDNRSSHYDFSLNRNGNREFEKNGNTIHQNNYTFGYTAVDQEYDKIAKLRYYTTKDLLSGMCKISCKDCMINGEIVTMFKCDTDSDKYKSNLIPGFIGINFIEDYSNQSTR